jgi:hypothetical protein
LFARGADESYRRSLLVYRTLGITNDVDEQDMRDLKLISFSISVDNERRFSPSPMPVRNSILSSPLYRT